MNKTIIFAPSNSNNNKVMEDDFNFEAFAVNIDSDCVSDDFDCYDLFGDRVENNDDDQGQYDNIDFYGN